LEEISPESRRRSQRSKEIAGIESDIADIRATMATKNDEGRFTRRSRKCGTSLMSSVNSSPTCQGTEKNSITRANA
jgi:hypothetical protein